MKRGSERMNSIKEGPLKRGGSYSAAEHWSSGAGRLHLGLAWGQILFQAPNGQQQDSRVRGWSNAWLRCN